ncbi:glycosyltransferase [Brenneria tiliae]|uniref:Glycosyltransferase n=1 Tax=Brenneria tiliae TaxID=2914984 RepID=A0ABT0MNR8_9GAMM|nr:glycosyltransferase [Brenneria tiliae]MCL2891232.1 glycosyltransferase [Brenneria tiliae]
MHAYEITKSESVKELGKYYKILFNQANTIFSVCEYMRDRIIKLGCDPNRIEVLHIGVDTENLSCKDINYCNQQTMRIIFVGRLTEKKGLPDLLESLSLLGKDVAFYLDIIGDGELQDYCYELIYRLNLIYNVKMHGSQDHQTVLEYMKKSDVLILPSKTSSTGDMEGIPVVLMEAMAMKKIVLSTYHSGISELIDNGVNGFLVNEGDIMALASNILYISTLHEEEMVIIKDNAYQKILEHFNIKVQTKKLAKKILEYTNIKGEDM